VMCGLSIVYLVTALGLLLPLGTPPYALTGVLPPLWVAIPALTIAGVALLGAGYLMATRLSSERQALASGLKAFSDRAPRQARRRDDSRPGAAGAASPGPDEGGVH
jgi:hypothetical protein